MALSADKSISRSAGVQRAFGVAAGEIIYHGAIVAMNAAGRAIAATGAATEQVIGVNEGDVVDNSLGGAGDVDVVVSCGATYGPFVNSLAHPLLTAGLGRLCYVEDDETAGAVAAIPGCVLGYLDRIATEGVYVFIPSFTMLGANIPGNLIVAGTIQGGATITAATGVTATTGGVTATAGDITADADDIVATAGDIIATAGDIEATLGTVTAGTGVIATTGGVTATAGDITADADDIVATAGDIIATAGDIIATAGDIYATAGQIRAQTAVTGGIAGQHAATATGGAPTQAEMVAAFGAGTDGQIALYRDTTPGLVYICGFSTVGGGWWHLAMTQVGA